MAVPSEIAAAKVKFASESTAAELLIEYQKRVFSQSDLSDMRWSGETDEGFENAIFEKGSPYLRLLLLESVTSHDVAVKLWAWADQSTELTSEQVLAVKRTLIEGSAAKALLFEGEYGQFNNKGKIGIVESLSRGEYWPLFSVFKNPWLKRLVAKVLLKEGVFESIDDKLFPTASAKQKTHPPRCVFSFLRSHLLRLEDRQTIAAFALARLMHLCHQLDNPITATRNSRK